MTQSTHIAAGQTAANGSDVTVTAGAPAVFTLDAAGIPDNIGIPIKQKIGSAYPRTIAVLSHANPGPMLVDVTITVRAERPDISDYGVDVAVMLDR
jgi:hypothetical protein